MQVSLQLISWQEQGAAVTVFEKEEKLGGVIRYVIPGFRIPEMMLLTKTFPLLKRWV